jgi:hypothetical protein
MAFVVCPPIEGRLIHDGDGALADERDRHRMGAHAVARDAAGGVGGVEALRGASDDPQGERGESTASADQQ